MSTSSRKRQRKTELTDFTSHKCPRLTENSNPSRKMAVTVQEPLEFIDVETLDPIDVETIDFGFFAQPKSNKLKPNKLKPMEIDEPQELALQI